MLALSPAGPAGQPRWERRLIGGLATGAAELTDRATGETISVPLDDLAKHVREAVTQALEGTGA